MKQEDYNKELDVLYKAALKQGDIRLALEILERKRKSD